MDRTRIPSRVNRAAWTGVPSVSPDGRWVSYWSVLGDQPHQIRVAPADGSRPAIDTGPALSDFFPWVWAPDSSKILMSAADGSDTGYLIDPEGGSYAPSRGEPSSTGSGSRPDRRHVNRADPGLSRPGSFTSSQGGVSS